MRLRTQKDQGLQMVPLVIGWINIYVKCFTAIHELWWHSDGVVMINCVTKLLLVPLKNKLSICHNFMILFHVCAFVLSINYYAARALVCLHPKPPSRINSFVFHRFPLSTHTNFNLGASALISYIKTIPRTFRITPYSLKKAPRPPSPFGLWFSFILAHPNRRLI